MDDNDDDDDGGNLDDDELDSFDENDGKTWLITFQLKWP